MSKKIKIHTLQSQNHFKKSRSPKKPKSIIKMMVLLTSCTALVACGRDFSQVKELGDRGELIKASSEVLAENFYQSCLRRAKIPINNLETSEYINQRINKINECQEKSLPAKKPIQDAYSVLTIYLEKLATVADTEIGAISDQEVAKLNKSFGNLGKALGEVTGGPLPSIITSSLPQAGGFVRAIFNLFASGIREDTIVPTVACTDDEINGLTQILEAIANQAFVNTLNNERQSIDSYYTNLLPQRPDISTVYHPISYPSERVSSLELVKYYNSDRDLLDKQEELAIAFADFLKVTRETHTKIAKMFRKELGLNSDEDYQSYCEKFEESIAKKSTAYQGIEMTPELSAKMLTILEEYNQETKPMLQTLKAANF